MKWTQTERDRLTEMWADGKSFMYDQIAQELGRPRGSIAGAIKRFGLTKRGKCRETTNYPPERKPAAKRPRIFEEPSVLTKSEPTKKELYAMFAQAAANTAKM